MHALAHLRQLRRYERQQRERIWADDDDQPKAAEVQVGVLGLGVLGTDAALKLGALGFKVAGWSASEKSLPGVACFSGSDGLKRLLAMTDMLVVLLPLTDATRGLIDASLLSSAQAGRPARRSHPHQRWTRRPAGRSRHPRRGRFGAPQGRVARRVRARAVAEEFAPLDPPRRLREPAQRRGLDARSGRRLRRPPDRGSRTRRAADEPRGSAARVLRRAGKGLRTEVVATRSLRRALFCSNSYW